MPWFDFNPVRSVRGRYAMCSGCASSYVSSVSHIYTQETVDAGHGS